MERGRVKYTDLVTMHFKGEIVDWCFKHGLVARFQFCKLCARPMDLALRKSRRDGVEWACGGDEVHTQKICQSIRTKSWFAGSRMHMGDILKLTYLWVKKCSVSFTCSDLKLSTATVVQWRRFCREVCVLDCIKNGDAVGGDGKVVEIEESAFGMRMFHRGKKVDGRWVLGGVERESNKCFFEVVPRRTKRDLLKVLETYVLPGTTVVSECFKSYDCLSDPEFVSFSTNRNIHLKDPGTHSGTNSTEGTWSTIKRSYRGCHRNTFDAYLFEYVWRRKHSESKDLFREFIQAIRRLYNPE